MFKKKKEKEKEKSKVKAGEPLCFYEKQELEVIKNTVTKKGIAQYCCKAMEKACEPYDTGERSHYDKDKIIANSRIYRISTNKIGIKTHEHYDYDSASGGYDYYNYMQFKYCPFCGTKINGYVEVD